MSITSTLFLFLFFPVTLLGYYLIRKELRDLFLLAASLMFYALSDPGSIGLLAVSIAVNYVLGVGFDLSDRWTAKKKEKIGSWGGQHYLEGCC